jgi:Tol biopolymer transport system component
VAFTRNRHVYAVRSRGGRAVRLARGTEPSWSPDGTQIAFLREDAFRSSYLFVLNWRTRRVRRISTEELRSGDASSDHWAVGPEWLPRPR